MPSPAGAGHYYTDGPYFCWRLRRSGLPDVVRKAKTSAALKKKVRAALKEADEGALVKKESSPRVEDFLKDWLDTFVKPPARSKSTYRQYEQIVRIWTVPYIGSLTLEALTPLHCQRLLNTLQTDHADPQTGKPLTKLSGTTACTVRTVNKTAIKKAISLGLIKKNPWDSTDRPRPNPPKMKAVNPDLIEKFRDECYAQSRYGPLLCFMLATGPRIHEALALQLEADIDLKRKTVNFHGQLDRQSAEKWEIVPYMKSESSYRTVALSEDAIEAIRRQIKLKENEKRKAGSAYKESGLLFCTETGAPIGQRNLNRALYTILENMGLPRLSVHDLRRTLATQMARHGAPNKVTQNILGHSNPRTTQKFYQAVDVEDQRRYLAKAMTARKLPGTKQGTKAKSKASKAPKNECF